VNTHLNVLLLLVVILVYAPTAHISADDTEPVATGTPNSGSEVTETTESTALSTDQGDRDGVKGHDEDKEKDNAKPEEGGDKDTTITPTAVLVHIVTFIVQDVDNEPVRKAKVKILPSESDPGTEKMTDDEGIASFKDLPVMELSVQVTAPGHRSHKQTFDMEIEDGEITIVLNKRD